MKIGHSTDLKSRLQSYLTISPRINILLITDKHTEIELQERFKNCLKEREIYHSIPKITDFASTVMKTQGLPYEGQQWVTTNNLTEWLTHYGFSSTPNNKPTPILPSPRTTPKPITDITVYTIEDHLRGKPPEIINLVNLFRARLGSINAQIIEYARKEYIACTTVAYQTANTKKPFILYSISRNRIRVYFKPSPEELRHVDTGNLLFTPEISANTNFGSYCDLNNELVDYFIEIARASFQIVFP